MIYTDAASAAPAISAQIAAAETILILTHVNPDGDAIGSMLGVWHYLNSLGKHAIPLASSPLPNYTTWLPGVEAVHVYQPQSELPAADLTILVDTASLNRIGQIHTDHAEALSQRPMIVIDHHITNDGIAAVNLIKPSAASTCELIYELLEALAVEISPELATCLQIGIVTDTQSFQTTATKPGSLHASAALLAAGADNNTIVQRVYRSIPLSTAMVLGASLSIMQAEPGIVWTMITQAMQQQANASDDASDDVMQLLQRLGDIKAILLCKERKDGTTKISLRSQPPINVAEIAQVWGGGGHTQAAGATLPFGPEQAAQEVLPYLRRAIADLEAK